jgi:hypothetical protein
LNQQSALKRSASLANLLDTVFRVPGTRLRFGLDPLLGLIPGAGDVAGVVLSGYIILEAARTGASGAVLLRMLANVGIDTILSAVPLLGDILDFGWKSNTRNLVLLQDHLTDPLGARSASRTFIVLLCLVLVGLLALTVVMTFMTIRWIGGLLF